MLAKRFLLLFLFIISCKDFGFDTADVIRANDAYLKIITAVSNKFVYCKSLGNNYSNLGEPSISYCNDDTFLHNKGKYVWVRSVDTCLNLIHFALCPENGTNFDEWQDLVIGSCHISEAYFMNSYKPFQGKVLGIPRNLYGLSLLCL
ncbi:hypothetical protein CH373_06105 [Leptospira perolatii]|uniref:Lipoprotein n=1 Tax=Leptospira perolatii TaxID=2023191 RepID=A0A2M9ZNT3_9LEPT|nr:hypothetical protein [Leptospira perolatii]PJZ70840.1 hypothetical protein CH360_04835 [Leptospira perolatii]PJZ73736.1 hypothetical protein CH373_06105 [Leptospira perolatii]